tara:strand:- start:460 stop:1239 length:780 start_codon:yes stop_codon:yes gene_type:complete
MGFLEQVKKNSNKQSTYFQSERNSDASARQLAAESIQTAMRELNAYLFVLVERLNRHPPDALISYQVEGCNGLSNLKQSNFELSVDNENCIRLCCLRYVYRRENDISFYRPNKAAGERQQQYLWNHKLKFKSRRAADDRWIFDLESFVPVEFEFRVDIEKFDIKLNVLNHEMLGLVSYTYDCEDINSLFLEELAKYILRKPSRFHALSGNVVPDDTLAKIRRQLAQRKAEREQELGEDSGFLDATRNRRKGLFKSLFRK